MTLSDAGLLVMRLAVGFVFAAHGAQKVFGWWQGPGLRGWVGAMVRMRFRPAPFWGVMSALVELLGGLLLAVGLLTPVVSAFLLAQSVIIVLRAHLPKGLWNREGGIEFPLQLLAASALFLTTGAGTLALDEALGLRFDDATRLALIGVAIVGAGAALLSGRIGGDAGTRPAGNT